MEGRLPQAPKGRCNLAQGNALGPAEAKAPQALKGRAKRKNDPIFGEVREISGSGSPLQGDGDQSGHSSQGVALG